MKKSNFPGPSAPEFLGPFKAFFERVFIEKTILRHGQPWEWDGKFPLELERDLFPPIPQKEKVTSEIIRARQSRIAEGGLDVDDLIAEVFWYAMNKPKDPEYCASLGLACGEMMKEMLNREKKSVTGHKSKEGKARVKASWEQRVMQAYRDILKKNNRDELEKLSERALLRRIQEKIGTLKRPRKNPEDAVSISIDTIRRIMRNRDKQKYPFYSWEDRQRSKRNVCDKTTQT